MSVWFSDGQKLEITQGGLCKLVFQMSFLEMENLKNKKVQKSFNENKKTQWEKASINVKSAERTFLQTDTCSNVVELLPRFTVSQLACGLVNLESHFWKDIWKYVS